MIVVLTLAMPCALAQVASGSTPLFQVRRNAAALLGAAVLAQVLAANPAAPARVLVPASFALGTAALAAILRSSGAQCATTTVGVVGGVANLVPIAVHGAMPVLASSRRAVSSHEANEPALMATKHVEVEAISEAIVLFSDWIPVPRLGAVISVGDVLLVIALAMLAVDRLQLQRDGDRSF